MESQPAQRTHREQATTVHKLVTLYTRTRGNEKQLMVQNK